MGKHTTGRYAARWLVLAFGLICFFALLTSALSLSFSAAEEIGPSSQGEHTESTTAGQSDNTSSDSEITSDPGTTAPEASSDGLGDSTAGDQPATDNSSADLPATDATASDSSEESSLQNNDGSTPPDSQAEPDSSSVTSETGPVPDETSTSSEAAEPMAPAAEELPEEPVAAAVIGNVDVPGSFPYDTTVGGFVFECENIYGNDFYAVKIDEGTIVPKADVSMFNVSSSGFRLFKNLNDATFGDYCWVLAADNMFTLASNLNIHTSEMYSEELLDVSGTDTPVLFPPDYWTTEPENDLTSRLNGTPIQAVQGIDTKFNTHLYRASQITFSNFIFSVEPGHQTTYAE